MLSACESAAESICRSKAHPAHGSNDSKPDAAVQERAQEVAAVLLRGVWRSMGKRCPSAPPSSEVQGKRRFGKRGTVPSNPSTHGQCCDLHVVCCELGGDHDLSRRTHGLAPESAALRTTFSHTTVRHTSGETPNDEGRTSRLWSIDPRFRSGMMLEGGSMMRTYGCAVAKLVRFSAHATSILAGVTGWYKGRCSQTACMRAHRLCSMRSRPDACISMGTAGSSATNSMPSSSARFLKPSVNIRLAFCGLRT